MRGFPRPDQNPAPASIGADALSRGHVASFRSGQFWKKKKHTVNNGSVNGAGLQSFQSLELGPYGPSKVGKLKELNFVCHGHLSKQGNTSFAST